MNVVSPRLAQFWSHKGPLRLGAVVAVLLCGMVAVGMGTQFGGLRADNGRMSSFAQAGKSLLAILQERSPGTRSVAEFTKTKRATSMAAPHERALAKVQHPPLPKEFVQALVPPVPVTPEAPLFANSTPLPVSTQLLTSAGPPIVTPLIPGGGNPLVPNVPGTPGSPGSPVPPSTPPLPEPGTWAMLLLGFALLGWKLRHQTRGFASTAA